MRFYVAQIALALGHLHQNNIVYRSLTLENVMLDDDGYISLKEFELSAVLEKQKEAEFVDEKSDYKAPEILNGAEQSYPVDWWTLGVLTYELYYGFCPFYTRSEDMKKKHEMIKHCHIYFPDPKKHGRLSKECKKFFWELLDKNVSTRLGTKGGLKEILEHPWLSGIDINGL